MEKELCPICLQPKKASSSGSITQWIASCSCDNLDSEEELFASLRICLNCNKRISVARHGSFTQWIFRSDLCSCGQPEIYDLQDPEKPQLDEPESFPVEYPQLEDIDVDFPYDRYQPIEEIGRGSSGAVFRCHDRLLNRIVAVKVLHYMADEYIVAFQSEARITSKLNHPNIIDIIDINTTEDGTPYMVFEYVSGISLREYIKNNGPIEWKSAVDLFIQIGKALSAAHEKGIFHRDLQPANILLTGDEDKKFVSKIIDFGIATFVKKQVDTISYAGMSLAGTPPYMGPDQAGGHEFDARSDIYSLGCVMFETLTGKPPYTGETAIEILNKQLKEELPLMSDLSEVSISRRLEDVVRKCLQVEKENRYQSAPEIVNSLQNCLKTDKTIIEKFEVEKPGRSKTFIYLCLTLLLLAGITISFSYFHIEKNKEPEPVQKESIEKDKAAQAIFRSSKDLGEFKPHETIPGIVLATQLTEDSSLKRLKGRDDITQLILKNSFVEGPGLVYLKELPLTLIDLNNTLVDDESILPLNEIPTLNYLVVERTKVTGKNLDQFKNLNRLNVVDSSFNDEGARAISKLKNLEFLELSGEHLTNAGWRLLESCPEIKIINITGNHIKSRKLKDLRKFKHLNRLAFANRNISKEDLKAVSGLNIRELEIWRGSSMEETAKNNLSGLRVKHLSIPEALLTEDEIEKLKPSLGGCELSILENPDKNKPETNMVPEYLKMKRITLDDEKKDK